MDYRFGQIENIPHACGGEPSGFAGGIVAVNIFPTHVGVNLYDYMYKKGMGNIPHACGGEPRSASLPDTTIAYSPRMWG